MSEERIPTMPQVSEERIPTMPQMSGERIPTRPQMSEERIPTMPQAGTERIATMPQVGGGQSGVQNAVQRSSTTGNLVLAADMEMFGEKGGRLLISANEIICATSGESQIYGCRKAGSEEKYVARVLTALTPHSDIKKRQARDKVIFFLDKMGKKNDSHILPLVDYGIIQANGNEYYVEIYPFCEGGDLGRRKGNVSYKELHDEIIPAVNRALYYFHKDNLVHRDIKPDNLYKYNGQVVVGDFGITCDLREDGFATDKYKTGTLGYYAPELMGQAAIKASDYYSFGQTIWTLYSGEMMYSNILRRFKGFEEEQRNQINFAMLNNEYYGLDEISREDSFLEMLLRGLLQYDTKRRFGYDQVERWITGDKSVALGLEDLGTKKVFSRVFNLFDKDCWDDRDVAETLCKHWDDAVTFLYDGGLKDFYSSQNYEAARFLNEIMKKYSSSSNENLIAQYNNTGLARTILYFSDNKILCWCGKVYKTVTALGGVAEETADKNEKTEEFAGLIRSGLIEEWYRKLPASQTDVADTLKKISDMLVHNEIGAVSAIYWTGFVLSGDTESMKIAGCDDIKSYVAFLNEVPGRLYGCEDEIPVVDSERFGGVLCGWGYEDAVKIFHGARNESYPKRYELLFDFMEQVAESEEERSIVRRLYHEYGPGGHLTYFREHMDEYVFKGSECRGLYKKIKAINSDGSEEIAEQRQKFEEMDALARIFTDYCEDDLIMNLIGLQGIKENCIYSNKLRNEWKYMFLGQSAPLGFKFKIGL